MMQTIIFALLATHTVVASSQLGVGENIALFTNETACADFDRLVHQSGHLWLLLFKKPYCPWCADFDFEWQTAAYDLRSAPRVRLGEVNMRACGSIASKFGVRNAPTTYLVQGGSNRELYSGPKSAGGLVSSAQAALGRWKVDLVSSLDVGVPIAIVNQATLDHVILQQHTPPSSSETTASSLKTAAPCTTKNALTLSGGGSGASPPSVSSSSSSSSSSPSFAWVLQVSSRWPPSPSLLDPRLTALGVKVAYANHEPRLMARLEAVVAATTKATAAAEAARATENGEKGGGGLLLQLPSSPLSPLEQRRADQKRKKKNMGGAAAKDITFVFPRQQPPPSNLQWLEDSSQPLPPPCEEDEVDSGTATNDNDEDEGKDEGEDNGSAAATTVVVVDSEGGALTEEFNEGVSVEREGESGDTAGKGWQRAGELDHRRGGNEGADEGADGGDNSGGDGDNSDGECFPWVIDVHELYFRDKPSSTKSSMMGSFKRGQEVHASCRLEKGTLEKGSTTTKEATTTKAPRADVVVAEGGEGSDSNVGCPWLRTCGQGTSLADAITGRTTSGVSSSSSGRQAYYFTRVAAPAATTTTTSSSSASWVASNPQVRVSAAHPRPTQELGLENNGGSGGFGNQQRKGLTPLLEALLLWAYNSEASGPLMAPSE